jgi:hypothetical protein
VTETVNISSKALSELLAATEAYVGLTRLSANTTVLRAVDLAIEDVKNELAKDYDPLAELMATVETYEIARNGTPKPKSWVDEKRRRMFKCLHILEGKV